MARRRHCAIAPAHCLSPREAVVEQQQRAQERWEGDDAAGAVLGQGAYDAPGEGEGGALDGVAADAVAAALRGAGAADSAVVGLAAQGAAWAKVGAEDAAARVQDLLGCGLTAPDLCSLLGDCPEVLLCDAQRDVQPVLDFLTAPLSRHPSATISTIPALDADPRAGDACAPDADGGLGLRRQDARRLLRSAPELLLPTRQAAPAAGARAPPRRPAAAAAGRSAPTAEVADASAGAGAAPPKAAAAPADDDDAFRTFLAAEEAERQRSAAEAELSGVVPRLPSPEAKGPSSREASWSDCAPSERLKRSAAALAALGIANKSLRSNARAPSSAAAPGALPALLASPPSTLFRFAACLSQRDAEIPPTALQSLLREVPSLPQRATAPVAAGRAAAAGAAAEAVFRACSVARSMRGAGRELEDGEASERVRAFAAAALSREEQKHLSDKCSEMTMEAPVAFFAALGLSPAEVLKVLRAAPGALLAEPCAALAPAAAFLAADLGLGVEGAARAIAAYPALLSLDVRARLLPAAKLASELSGHAIGSLAAARAFRAFPSILALSPEEQMRPVAAFLEAMGAERRDLRALVGSLPSVLSYDVAATLWPKCEYLLGCCRLDIAVVCRIFPAALSYPLQAVMEPRFEFLAARERLSAGAGGFNAASAATPSEAYSASTDADGRSVVARIVEREGLGAILAPSDEDFARRVAGVVPAEYEDFKEGYLARRDAIVQLRGDLDPKILEAAQALGLAPLADREAKP